MKIMKTRGMLKAVLTVVLSSMASLPVHAETHTNPEYLSNQLIKNSYIVTFKEPTEGSSPVIEPPDQEMMDKAKRGEIQIPFGEHSTGQSEQEIAEKINLNGEVIAIFETINAIQVEMDAQEAYRLSLDERVLQVEQDMMITTGSVTQNMVLDDNPMFQNGILILPSVDLPEKGGSYQNVKFQLTEQGEWQLLDFLVTKELQYIDQVEMIKTDSFPIQVFLKVAGHFNGCQEMGQISYRLLEQKFDIWMYPTQDEKFSTGEFTCVAAMTPFTHIIPLPVYSLAKGEYEYSVNGRYTGTFNLAEDNKLK